jgi:hypothetical protein
VLDATRKTGWRQICIVVICAVRSSWRRRRVADVSHLALSIAAILQASRSGPVMRIGGVHYAPKV